MLNNRLGFTLTEILIAVFIFSAGIIPLFKMFSFSKKAAEDTIEYTHALEIATTLMEDYRSRDIAELEKTSSINDLKASNLSPYKNALNGQVISNPAYYDNFKVSIIISKVYSKDIQGKLDFVKIKVRVFWESKDNKEKEVVFNSLICDQRPY